MSAPVVLGVDPGFASFGWARVRFDHDHPRVLSAGVIRTKKSSRMQSMLASEDSAIRTRLIFERLRAVVADGEPPWAFAAEAMSWPRNASAAAKVALGWGPLVCTAALHDMALLQASPQHVKKTLCGKASASKDEVADAVARRTNGTSTHAVARAGVPAGEYEHMHDAVAVALAVADYDVLKLMKRR